MTNIERTVMCSCRLLFDVFSDIDFSVWLQQIVRENGTVDGLNLSPDGNGRYFVDAGLQCARRATATTKTTGDERNSFCYFSQSLGGK